MGLFSFFYEGVKTIKTTGSIAPTSKYTSKKMLEYVDFKNATCIVELGAGEGCITKHILKNMRQDAILLSFEINDKFCEDLRKIKDKRLHIIQDSAENLQQYLEAHQLEKADFIVSAIPMVVLPKNLSESIVKAAHYALRKGGNYIQLHYSKLTLDLYQTIFGNAETHREWRNLPPAVVVVSEKQETESLK